MQSEWRHGQCEVNSKHEYVFAGTISVSVPGTLRGQQAALMVCRFCLDRKKINHAGS